MEEMWRTRISMTELAFLVCGLLIIFVGWKADFLAVFAVLQLAAAFIIPYTRFRLDLAWLGITAFLILAYIVTRTMTVWPIGVVEEVEPLGVVSKLVEVLTILVLVSLMRSERTACRSSVEASAVPNR